MFGETIQAKKFTREHTYRASDSDSKNTSRQIASDQIRAQLLREIGVYLVAKQKFTTSASEKEFSETIESIAAGIVEMKILAEKWDGEVFWLKAEMTVDPDDVERKLKAIREEERKKQERENKRIAELENRVEAMERANRRTYEPPSYNNNYSKKEKAYQYKEPIETVGWLEYAYSKTAPLQFALGVCGRVGGYARVKTDVNFSDGNNRVFNFNIVDDAGLSKVDFNDKKYYRFAVTGGLMVRLFEWCYLYGGAGYGKYGAAYKITDDEKTYYCPDFKKGLEVEGGMILKLGIVSLSVGYNTLLRGSNSQRFSDVSVGIGLIGHSD
ncbi:hypothetical protein AGMMS4957_09480 [Bacteroidia bacterium]|nr:hypothetical protein AGMMS4957_09480 [Bacteroidia bacterium]